MANTQISAQEQLLIELLNRARLDPKGEAARYGVGLNDGLSAGKISAAPKAPLAWNADLGESAALHSEWMLDTNKFSHTGEGGTNSNDRMRDAGFQFTGSWASGENISWRGTTGTLDPTAVIQEQHKSLFLSTGHRENIMRDYREVGVAQELDEFTGSQTYNASMVTDTTGATGGYGVAIPTGLSGTATVAVTANGVTQQATLAMAGTNVKLDLVSGRVLASSTDMTLGASAKDGRLLGAADLDLKGNTSASRLYGNAGANDIRGGGGNDVISGASGNDQLWSEAGNDTLNGGDGADRLEGGRGNDIYTGGTGADSFVFTDIAGSTTGLDRVTDLGSGDRIVIDLIGTLPSEATWEDAHITSATGGWTIALDDGSSIFVAGATLDMIDNALFLA